MRPSVLHNYNLFARFLVYAFWAWVTFFDGLHLTLAMRSLLNFILLADVVTCLLYQIYLLPRMVVQVGVGALVNLLVILLLIKGVKAILPQTPDLQAMALMVFLAVFGIKGMYYFLLEMERDRSQ
jgi:hypothetical protein